MFTGIIEATGKIVELTQKQGDWRRYSLNSDKSKASHTH